MDRTFEPALRTLLPAFNGDFPPELLQLARSLYAQSRTKCNLKPEEEIARSYVCAHLACERLKQALNLPNIQAKPPCPPRVYKKLLSFFQSALPARTSQSGTDGPRPTPTTPTASPSKPRTLSRSTSQATHLKRAPSARNFDVTADDEVPSWIMPAIRDLCKSFAAPRAVPHVYAGVCSVAKLLRSLPGPTGASSSTRARGHTKPTATSGDSNGGSKLEDRIPAILVTVFFYVQIRLTGEEVTPKELKSQISKAMKSLHSADRGLNKTQKDMSAEVIKLLPEARDRWLDMGWYQNIPEYSESDDEHTNDNVGNLAEDMDVDGMDASSPRNRLPAHSGDEPASSGVIQRGLGTMMQDKIDYCSVDRKRDFIEWKEGIMRRIEEIERDRPTAMDTST